MTNTKRQHIVQAAPQKEIKLEKATACSAVGDKTEINWLHTGLLVITPTIAFIGMLWGCIPKWQTVIFGVLMYFWTGLGITAGYHRLWSHRAYDAHPIVRWLLCIGGAAAFEGSAKWWCRNHRAHHRYTDTNKDPYNARRGFFYAHLGWMLVKQNIKQIGWADITDLQQDPMIMFQHKYYGFVSIGFGIVFPSVVCALWGDFWGGYFYAAMLRIVLVHHATFCVNSLAHWFGEKNFSDHHTAFDSFITAVFTFGEGYHNYHHEFPVDYRNGIKFYHYDPTKWLIRALSLFGLTYGLKQISTEEITKARVQMAQRKIDFEAAKIRYGRQFNSLPDMTISEFKSRCDRGEALVIVNDIVHDVSKFVHEHPGGRQTLLDFVGNDVTALFKGEEGEHVHSLQAMEFLALLRIANVKK